MMANRRNGTIYVGVTSDLVRRVAQHRDGGGAGFAARYGCRMLVWFEMWGSMEGAIVREKAIKAGSRRGKLALIEQGNPDWRDLGMGLV
ncbi:GIY-YIG nuclease family protein [Acidiphilium acidophilum]|nr:GIY-YIG nuclease family protein [Acidiphilium acidophilum]